MSSKSEAKKDLISGGLSLLDQVVVSATNFLTIAILSHHCSTSEMGVFALTWTVANFFRTAQERIVLALLRLRSASVDRSHYVFGKRFGPWFLAQRGRNPGRFGNCVSLLLALRITSVHSALPAVDFFADALASGAGSSHLQCEFPFCSRIRSRCDYRVYAIDCGYWFLPVCSSFRQPGPSS